MAVTTQISDLNWRRPTMTRELAKAWFGQRVPEDVVAIEVMYNSEIGQREVRWKRWNDPTIHTMPFEQTDECVAAALVAMKLTC